MKQRTTEWLEITKKGRDEYHKKQYEEPYRSTVKFCNWLESLNLLHESSQISIGDIGAGAGANLYYMAKRYPQCNFIGIDINPDLVKWGNEHFKEREVKNAKLEAGDLYDFPIQYQNSFDGLIMLQTLSWLPDYRGPIERLISLNSNWIAITSLFYEGDVNCKIEVQDYTQPLGGKPYKESYYNSYPLNLVKRLFHDHGYEFFCYLPFEIDIDLEKPKSGGMGTYTVKTEAGKRLQISGPVLMKWYFILAKK